MSETGTNLLQDEQTPFLAVAFMCSLYRETEARSCAGDSSGGKASEASCLRSSSLCNSYKAWSTIRRGLDWFSIVDCLDCGILFSAAGLSVENMDMAGSRKY